MSNMYTFQYTDFLNDSISTEKFGDELTVSGLEYINMDSAGVYMFFDHELSGADYTTLSGIVAAHDGIPYPEELLVKTGSQPAGKSILTDGSGESKYLNTNNYRFAFRNADNTYIEESSTNWVSVLTIPFAGTDDSCITKFSIVFSADDDNGDISGQVRLYDIINLKEMCVVTGTNMTTEPTLYSSTNMYNLPSAETMMEIQYRKTVGAANEYIRLYYVEVA